MVTIAGKDHYLGTYGSKASRALYDRLIGDWLARGRTPDPNQAPAEPFTITQLLAAYWEHAKVYYRKDGKPSGEITPLRLVLRELRRLYGPTEASEFGPLKLRAFQAALIAKGWTRKSINQQIGRVVRVFAWGVSVELVASHVPDALREVPGLRFGRSDAVEGEPVEPVADSVVEATLPFLSLVVAAMVRIQRLTGARPGEVCSMRPCDIDRTGEVWVFTPSQHKTQHHGRRRIIAIGPKAQEILAPFLLRPADGFCFSPAESERKRRDDAHEQRITPLSCGNVPGSNRKRGSKRKAGAGYDVHAYRRAIAYACERAFGFPAALRIGRNIANLMAQLQSQTMIPYRVKPPSWLDGDSGDELEAWPARDVLAFLNVLLNLPALVRGDDFNVRPATPKFFTTAGYRGLASTARTRPVPCSDIG